LQYAITLTTLKYCATVIVHIRDAIYNGTGNSAHYRLAYADFGLAHGQWRHAAANK